MTMQRKCTVIEIGGNEYDKLYEGVCQNVATEFVATEDIEAVNQNLAFPWHEVLVGNDICDMHCERVGDI